MTPADQDRAESCEEGPHVTCLRANMLRVEEREAALINLSSPPGPACWDMGPVGKGVVRASTSEITREGSRCSCKDCLRGGGMGREDLGLGAVGISPCAPSSTIAVSIIVRVGVRGGREGVRGGRLGERGRAELRGGGSVMLVLQSRSIGRGGAGCRDSGNMNKLL